MKRMLTTALVLCALIAPAVAAHGYPETIALPNGWQPEGIAADGDTFYAGSRATGAIWRGNLRTGQGDVLVEPWGGAALGLKVDRRDRLFVAGGGTGTARVYDADDGDLLREYVLAATDEPDEPTFINDVTLTKRAAYFTDSHRQQLYVLDLCGKRLPRDARTLALTGDFAIDNDPMSFELNGIAGSKDGRRLIAVQSRLGKLFLINPRSGDTEEIDLGGESVPNGDGLLLDGRTLYVVQNRLNQIAVIRLDGGLDDGRIVRYLTDGDFDVPTTIAESGRYLWAVNARFTTPATPDTPYDVVRVSR
jgi:sugar lactone lactonase YvrE